MSVGWIVNDLLVPHTTVKGSFLFKNLMEWFPNLENHTGTGYSTLAAITNVALQETRPDYIIRNATYFPRLDSGDIPTIAVMQDVAYGVLRQHQIDVCENAFTIYNSEFTKAQYPELHYYPHAIIPLSIDFDLFKPDYTVQEFEYDVCWVGSGNTVKGIQILRKLIEESDLRYCLILKDKSPIPELDNVKIFRMVPHDELPALYAKCKIGLCTSSFETQHLAGIEMGACGLPLVTTNVGIYWNRPDGMWGQVAEPWEMGEIITDAVNEFENSRHDVRAYWEQYSNATHQACRNAWKMVLENVQTR